MSSSRDERELLELETLRTQDDSVVPSAPVVPCLTILQHPNLRRIGERAEIPYLSAHRSVSVCRTEPPFAGEDGEHPLATPYVSRKAAELHAVSGGGIAIKRVGDGKLKLNGRRVDTELVASALDIDRGAVIAVGGRVLLLLHRIPLDERPPDYGLVGRSPAIDEVRRAIKRVADTDVPVLIRGATGVGKEHVARAIFQASKRADAPYASVNMATIPATTAASELFGHVKGAFTGATASRKGMFENADGGTLFLDEIGETPAEVQPMLLRVLEHGELSRVGDQKNIEIDVRVIAATDADLDGAVAKGHFRAALLHRLQGYEIHVPPLRERRDDVARLFLHFLELELARIDELHRLDVPEPGAKPWLPTRLMSELITHPWPGNVRQLRNVVRQLVISSRSEEQAQISAIVRNLSIDDGPPEEPAPPAATTSAKRKPSDISEEELVAALQAAGWSVGKAAKALGVPRSTLNGRIVDSPNVVRARDISAEELRELYAKTGGDVDAMADQLRVSKRGLKLRLTECGIA